MYKYVASLVRVTRTEGVIMITSNDTSAATLQSLSDSRRQYLNF